MSSGRGGPLSNDSQHDVWQGEEGGHIDDAYTLSGTSPRGNIMLSVPTNGVESVNAMGAIQPSSANNTSYVRPGPPSLTNLSAGSMDSVAGVMQPMQPIPQGIPQAQAVALAELLAAQRGHLQQQHQQEIAGIMALEDQFREAAGGAGSRPTCAFFKRTGTCAYGDRCKFLHPVDCPPPSLNERGYPRRPEEPNCPHYIKKGWCAFGATCKFHHAEGHVGPPLGFNPNMANAYLQQFMHGGMPQVSSLSGQGDGMMMMGSMRGSGMNGMKPAASYPMGCNPLDSLGGVNGYNLDNLQLGGNSFVGMMPGGLAQPSPNAAHMYALQQQQAQQFYYGNAAQNASLDTLSPASLSHPGMPLLGGWNQGQSMQLQGGARIGSSGSSRLSNNVSSQNYPNRTSLSYSNPPSTGSLSTGAPLFDSTNDIVNAMNQLRMGNAN